jgi:hypothetical protein
MSRKYTNVISETQCIGDSLDTININYENLDLGIQNIDSLLTSIPSLMNIRMSLSPALPITTADSTVSNTLYIHPYNGNVVFLYNTVKNIWELKRITNVISKSLQGLAANTNYDVYLSYNNITNSFEVNFVAWTTHLEGSTPPATGVQDGVLVKSDDFSNRLIGCLRTTSAGQTQVSFGRTPAVGGSHPKIFVWNLYNQQPTSFSILETGTIPSTPGGINYWDSTINGDNAGANGPFEMFGGAGNKVSFICRQPIVTALNSIHYTQNNTCFYFGYSLDKETPTTAQLFANTPGVPIYESCRNGDLAQSFYYTVPAGYHYIQLVSMTYASQLQRYLVWTGDRHSYGTVGTLAAY